MILLNRPHLATLHRHIPVTWKGICCHSADLRTRVWKPTNLVISKLQNTNPRCGFGKALLDSVTTLGARMKLTKKYSAIVMFACESCCCWPALAKCWKLWKPPSSKAVPWKWTNIETPKASSKPGWVPEMGYKKWPSGPTNSIFCRNICDFGVPVLGPRNGTVLIIIITSGPKNGSILRPQKLGPRKCKIFGFQPVFRIKIWGEVLVPALMILNLQNWRMVAFRIAMTNQTKNLSARIPKKLISSWQSNVPIYLYSTHTNNPTLGDVHAWVQHERHW